MTKMGYAQFDELKKLVSPAGFQFPVHRGTRLIKLKDVLDTLDEHLHFTPNKTAIQFIMSICHTECA